MEKEPITRIEEIKAKIMAWTDLDPRRVYSDPDPVETMRAALALETKRPKRGGKGLTMSEQEYIHAVWAAAMTDRHDQRLAGDYETPWEECPAAKAAMARVPDRMQERVWRAVTARLGG